MTSYSELLRDPRWQKKRLEILERDDWQCQSCWDKKNTLHVHHKFYQGSPWEVPSEYLVTLCARCHESVSAAEQEMKLGVYSHFRRAGFTASFMAKFCEFLSPEMRFMTQDDRGNLLDALEKVFKEFSDARA